MLSRWLFISLMVLCGAGLLLAWMPDRLAWSIFEALIFSLLIVWSAGWARGKLGACWSWLFPPFLGVIAWGLLQLGMGWSAYAFATETDIIRWGCYFSIFLLAFQLSAMSDAARSFRVVFATYALTLAVVSVLQEFAGNGKIYWLFETAEKARLGPFYNNDHYASFAALALPAAVVAMVRRPNRRWFFAVVTAVLYASVVASASRGGFVLLTLELAVLFLVLRLGARGGLGILVLCVVFVLVVGWQPLYERLRLPDPYAGRREVAASTIQMIRANPWKGFGLGCWTQVYPAYAQRDFGVFVNAAHNDWLQWWAEGGVPVLFCLALLACGSAALTPRTPWGLGVPIVFLHCMIEFPMQGRFLPAVVFLVFGASAGSARRHTHLRSGDNADPSSQTTVAA